MRKNDSLASIDPAAIGVVAGVKNSCYENAALGSQFSRSGWASGAELRVPEAPIAPLGSFCNLLKACIL